MPYGTGSASADAKVERCVAELMKRGQDKVSAIKICKSNIKSGKEPKRG